MEGINWVQAKAVIYVLIYLIMEEKIYIISQVILIKTVKSHLIINIKHKLVLEKAL